MSTQPEPENSSSFALSPLQTGAVNQISCATNSCWITITPRLHPYLLHLNQGETNKSAASFLRDSHRIPAFSFQLIPACYDISTIMFDKAKWSLCGGIAPRRLQGEARKQEIKLLVSDLCLMVTDNSNFCRFKLSSFLLPFPLGQENTITSSTAIIISHFCFAHTASAGCLFSISSFSCCSLPCRIFRQTFLCIWWWMVYRCPREIVTWKTPYITSTANKTQKVLSARPGIAPSSPYIMLF